MSSDLLALATLQGDKYSPNLRSFVLRWHRKLGKTIKGPVPQVYRLSDGRLYIGYLDDYGALIGACLNTVLGRGASTQTFCYAHIRNPEWVEGFWEQYGEDGRCAIDRDHTTYFIGDNTRWRVDGDHRSCLWCGKVSQQLKRWTETKTVQHEEWVTA